MNVYIRIFVKRELCFFIIILFWCVCDISLFFNIPPPSHFSIYIFTPSSSDEIKKKEKD